MIAILPPDTPEDIYPVPYERRWIARVFPVAKNVIAAMRAEGINTMADFDTWQLRGGVLTDLTGIGAATAETIVAVWESLQETR